MYAGHAASSRTDPKTSRLVLSQNEDLTVEDMLHIDLNGLSLIVFAACESLGIDAQLNENPLSLVVASLLAGASAAIGSHFRVEDAHASRFTRSVLKALANGDDVRHAYSVAVRSAAPHDPTFTLLLARSDYQANFGARQLPESMASPITGTQRR
jgi:CHAT domain